MRIIKLNHDISKYTPSRQEGVGQIKIEIGDRVKYYDSILKWITGKWLQGFLISSFHSDIGHPGSGSNKYTLYDAISAVQKEGKGDFVPVKWDGESNKYLELPQLNLTGGSKMKIVKVTQNSGQNFIRFDKNARVEMFVDEYDIRSRPEYDDIIAQADITDELKTIKLKELCVEIAQERLAAIDVSSAMKITVDGLSVNDINIDRIRWDRLLHPNIE
jgi:hypothetical protein